MSKITIKKLSDVHDCETCGTSYATGYEVTVDGKQFGDYEPSAYCFDDISFDFNLVLQDLMKHLGHELVFLPPYEECNN